MADTVSKALAKRQETPRPSMIDAYAADLAEAIPRTGVEVSTFIRLADHAIRYGDEALRKAAEANPLSLMITLVRCAQLGHVPGSKDFYFVVFANQVTGIEGYQGLIARFMRAMPGLVVKAEVVRQNDGFDWSPTTMDLPVHVFDALASDQARGPLKGAYAWGVLPDGQVSRCVVMGKDEIMKHKAVAKTKKFWEGPWEPSMWLKTVVKGLEPWLPTSAEYQREAGRTMVAAERIVTARGGDARELTTGPDDAQPFTDVTAPDQP